MFQILLLTLCICVVGLGVFLYYKQNKTNEYIESVVQLQGRDFLQNLEFLFNRMQQTKEDTHKHMLLITEPLSKALKNFEDRLFHMDQNNTRQNVDMKHTMQNLFKCQTDLMDASTKLYSNTKDMLNLFKKPSVRGRWGEVQLRRVVEIAGMLPYCEFETQLVSGDFKPDLVIRLPNSGFITVDAKAPMEAYFKFLDGENDLTFRKELVKLIKNHIYTLAKKEYWKLGSEDVMETPEIVVMFIPMESIWLHAIEEDSLLMEYAAERNVIVATPMTLIGLLKTIAYGWSHVQIAKEAQKLRTMFLHMRDIFKSLLQNLGEANKLHYEYGRKVQNIMEIIKKTGALTDEIMGQPTLDEIE